MEPDDIRPVDASQPRRSRVVVRGRALGALGRELATVGVYRRPSRRAGARPPDTASGQEFGGVGTDSRCADREPLAPLRREHRLGLLGVLGLRPRAGRRAHVLPSAVAGSVCTRASSVPSTGPGSRPSSMCPRIGRSRRCRPSGGSHHRCSGLPRPANLGRPDSVVHRSTSAGRAPPPPSAGRGSAAGPVEGPTDTRVVGLALRIEARVPGRCRCTGPSTTPANIVDP